jgi:hypothetical protein
MSTKTADPAIHTDLTVTSVMMKSQHVKTLKNFCNKKKFSKFQVAANVNIPMTLKTANAEA